MTVWGIGRPWGLAVVAYAVLITTLDRHYSLLPIPTAFSVATTAAAVVLLAIGVPLYVLAAKAMFRGFAAGRLVTTGPYALCRHPIYGAWIVFLLPAIELLLRSWLGLTTSVFAYALLRFMARTEERYLIAKFGEAYLAYRRRIPFVFPLGFLRTGAPAQTADPAGHS